jgi:hypothetical protein
MGSRRLCQIHLRHAIKSRQQWKWAGTTGALAHDDVALSAPLARATPQVTLPGYAKRMHHEAALTIVGLPSVISRTSVAELNQSETAQAQAA